MPKVKFRREDIIKATYEIMKEDGIENISARKIAKKFKGSTAPIYANFGTIEELKDEIIKMTMNQFKEYLYKVNTGREIFDGGFGFVKFARDEKELFRAIFLDASEGFKELYEKTIEYFLQEDALKRSFPRVDYEKAKKGLLRLWVYLFGYATLVYSNPHAKEEETDEKIAEKIHELSYYFREFHELRMLAEENNLITDKVLKNIYEEVEI